MFNVNASVRLLCWLLFLLWTGRTVQCRNIHRMDSGISDEDSEWADLFGHLSSTSPAAGSAMSTSMEKNDNKSSPEKAGKPLIFNPDDKESFSGIGTHSEGNMGGIAIAANKGTSLGIYMGNSSYNSFNYNFGSSNKK